MNKNQKLQAICDPAWTQILTEETHMVGLIAAKIVAGHTYVFVSRNPDHIDTEAYEMKLLPTEKLSFKAKICDTINHGFEISESSCKAIFPAEYEAVVKILKSK